MLSIARDVFDRLIAGAGGGGAAVPLPVRDTLDGLPAALWTTNSVADFVPVDEGVNVTVTVCAEAPALTVNVIGLAVNCEASVPNIPMPDRVSAASPVFPTVNVSALLWPTCTSPNESEVADRLMDGRPAPTPLRGMDEGLPAALWETDREADFGPADDGVNVTVTAWLPPAAIVAVVGDTVNCEESGPVTVIPVTDRLALPVLLIVNVF
ncbi:MAG: hypothetical protein A3F84_27070 [Candidatus Handelsmanbacteria bacterium RIFCSPLOWO2_12_FULL_64_10]|uniref:Uncharacterized protein n=1 Tax=Handelsmanbacteria sp. (strain RIFCSPLOWO2_12_FULL_64_10) TaxID=1817868 RepID=A0A1F6C8J5_HANXR|nr:MAG: hypothetical protein A3F84_27070 [Candidatus Handelsmanbacteria bacterium RIFCSPLOWO2_12_FULL_64_10]